MPKSLTSPEPPVVLTIAGSDSGGAAGLQADLRAFAALGVYGTCAVTAVTAQNSVAVTAVHPIPVPIVKAQLIAALADYGAAAVKTGFLGRADLIAGVAEVLAAAQRPYLVVDPILVNYRGDPLFDDDVVAAYRDHLLPLATIITPNRREAELLTATAIDNAATAESAARALVAAGAGNALLTGVLLAGDNFGDLLAGDAGLVTLPATRLPTANTHGSGDTLSAAIAAHLARGMRLPTAVRRAHAFTQRAIARSASWHLGAGHGPVWPAANN